MIIINTAPENSMKLVARSILGVYWVRTEKKAHRKPAAATAKKYPLPKGMKPLLQMPIIRVFIDAIMPNRRYPQLDVNEYNRLAFST